MTTATAENILDVTVLPPQQKHPTIFQRFDALAEGETLNLHNDHDPKPLYYQLLGERGNIFDWTYLEQGPQWWRIAIRKKVVGESGGETLGELVAKDYRKAQVFRKYGLDFCCGGKKTVKEACATKGLDFTKVEADLQATDRIPDNRQLPYTEWEAPFLTDYIVNTHHAYVRKALPDVQFYARKVARVHGSRHPELIPVLQLVEKIAQEMTSHMVKEEQVLFPYIKALFTSNGELPSQAASFGSVQSPIAMMEAEHEDVGGALEEIRSLTNDYTLPGDACASYSLLYRLLEAFEEDLHLHVHLENNILFPKALDREKELQGQGQL